MMLIGKKWTVRDQSLKKWRPILSPIAGAASALAQSSQFSRRKSHLALDIFSVRNASLRFMDCEDEQWEVWNFGGVAPAAALE
jgi:hypothetical protein